MLAVAELAHQVRDAVDVQQVAFPQHGLLSLPGTAELLDEALQAGATVVGGLDPAAEGDAEAYLDVVLGLAARHGAAVDLHFHGHGAEGLRELELLAERTVALGLQGRVVASHCYAFGDLDEAAAGRLAERFADAGIGVVTAAPYSFPVPPLRLLAEAGVVTGIGHDGIRDLWGPYGTGDLLERGSARGVPQRLPARRRHRAGAPRGHHRRARAADRRPPRRRAGRRRRPGRRPRHQRRGGGGPGAGAARGRQAWRGQSGSRSARSSTSAAGAVSRHASKVSSASSSRSMPSR